LQTTNRSSPQRSDNALLLSRSLNR
jgi:hypothetical protein